MRTATSSGNFRKAGPTSSAVFTQPTESLTPTWAAARRSSVSVDFETGPSNTPNRCADGETAWFVFYGLASPLYRLVVLVGIALYLAAEFLVVGVGFGIV